MTADDEDLSHPTTLATLRTALEAGFHITPGPGLQLLDALERARATAVRLESELHGLIGWIAASGYPLDWSRPDDPIPASAREPLAAALWLRENATDEELEDYRHLVAEEGGWMDDYLERPRLKVVDP